MPPTKDKVKSRTTPGTLLDLFGIDYASPDDPRLSPEEQEAQRRREAVGWLTPELAQKLRAEKLQLDPRYRIDPNPALSPGEDRIELGEPTVPPLQLDPRYRIDADPALAPGESRIRLDNEPWPGTDLIELDRSPVAGPEYFPKQGPEPGGRQYATPAGPPNIPPGMREALAALLPKAIQPTPATDLDMTGVSINGGPTEPLDAEAPVAGPPNIPPGMRQALAALLPNPAQLEGTNPNDLDITGMSVNGGAMESMDSVATDGAIATASSNTAGAAPTAASPVAASPVAASPVYAGPQTQGRAPAHLATSTYIEPSPAPGQAPNYFGGPGLAGMQQPAALAAGGPGIPAQAGQGGTVPQGGAVAPGGASPTPSAGQAIDYGLPSGQIRNSKQGIALQNQLAQAGVDAGFQANAAKLQSQWAQDDELVKAGQDSYDSLVRAQTQRANEREAVRRIADAKIAKKQQAADALAGKEPDPSRLWNNMEGWRKAVFGLSMLANALANSRNLNHVNPITQMLTGMVKEDVERQSDVIEKQRLRAKEGIAEANLAKQEDLADVEDSYTQTITRLQALDRLAAQKAATAGRGSALEAAYQGARVELAKVKQEITAQQTTILANTEAQARAHAHAKAMAQAEAEAALARAKVQAAAEVAKQQAEVAKEQAKAKAEVDKEERKAKAETEKDLRYVPSETGLRLVTGRDERGNPVVMDPAKARLHKDYVKDAAEMAANANQLHANITELNKLLEDKDNVDAILKGDGEVNSKVTLLGRQIATNPAFNKGVTSDSDVRQGSQVISGLANDPNFLSTLRSIPGRMDMMKAALKSYGASVPAQINRQLKQFPLPEGGNLEWVPATDVEPVKDTLLLPGEREVRASQAISADAGTAVDRAPTNRLPPSDEQLRQVQAVDAQTQGMTASRRMEVLSAKLDQQASEQVADVEARGKADLARLDKDAPDYGEKARGVVANMEAARKIIQKRAEDAKLRYAVVNEGQLDETRKREDEVVRKLAGLGGSGPFAFAAEHTPRDIPEPSNKEVKDALSRKGFDVAKLSQADIDAIRKRAVWLAKNPSQPIRPLPR